MSISFELQAEFRGDQGKGASRRLRRDGKVPAVLYGGGEAPRAITLSHRELLKQVENEAFFSHIIELKVGDKKQSAIVKDMQRHPAKRVIMHIDFQRVVAGDAIRMNVPIHFIGEDVAPGVKTGGGIVSHMRNEVEIECLPKNLPEFLSVDVSQMELDDMLHLSDIVLPEGVEILELAQGPEHDQPIVSVHRPAKIEIEPEEGEEAAPEGDEAEPADES